MKSKYGEFTQYHNSLDNLEFVTAKGLKQGFELVSTALKMMETNRIYKITTFCEPNLGKRGLYPTTSDIESVPIVRDLLNVITHLDGEHDVLDISEICGLTYFTTISIINKLIENDLVSI
jgi:aminopeptidase-like protein